MSAAIRGNATAGVSGDELTPGEHLRTEIERLGLDQVAVSQATGVSRQSINNIVNGRQPISRAMAGKLGRLTGRSSDYWLRASFPRKSGGARGRVKSTGESARPLGVGVLVNHQIVRAVQDGIIDIDPFDEANVQPASVDLTLDDFIITTTGDKVDITAGQVFALKTGRTVNVSTKEWIALPRDYIGRVGAMASLASLGIITSHGFQVDPGFEGNLQFCIFNAGGGDFELQGGMPIISLEIMPLSATPSYEEKDTRHLNEARNREKVVTLFRNDVCDRLIRDEIRRFAKAEMRGDQTEARIPELGVEFSGASEETALAAAVQGALNGLKTLCDRPAAARDDREKYTTFFGALADRLHLDTEQARRAVACLGLTAGHGDAPIITLRDGSEAMLQLPTSATRISLRHLARQLREDPADLVLMLAGLRPYGAS
jgi:deoxycytidine triphosphate deaminase/addiction module HigA family antidote